jgi:hypothetical protein
MKNRARSYYAKTVFGVVVFYLLAAVLSGPFRYYLILHGLAALVYLPNILVVAVLLASLARPSVSKVYLAALYLLLLSALVGVAYVRTLPQVLFGLYVWTPFLLGIVAYKTLIVEWSRFLRFASVLFAITIIGIIVSSLVPFPWMGLRYSFGDFEIEASRQWTTFGIKRSAGFARASFSASIQSLLLGSTLISFALRRWQRIVVWLLAGVAIVLTTTKAALGVYVLLSIYFVCRAFLPRRFWVILALGIALAELMLPVSALLARPYIILENRFERFLFASLNDRLQNVWPNAFELVVKHGSWVLGRGVGGMGAAQRYFEALMYNPADNMFLYIYGTFGIFAALAMMIFAASTRRLHLRRNLFDGWAYCIVLAALAYGVTTNVVESPFFAFFIGFSVSHLYMASHMKVCVTRLTSIPSPGL